MGLDALDVLIGDWWLTGRSVGATEDDVLGGWSAEWACGGKLIVARGRMQVSETVSVESVELIWFDPATGDFPAHVHTGSGAPLAYVWTRDGSTLTHADDTSTYTGTISPDGRMISGGWRPNPGVESTPGNTYDAVMHRVV